ncbi:MAG: hypothetical protein QXJ17_04560 [Nitrososphaeria archaeon]
MVERKNKKGRPATRMKQLATLYLENPRVLSDLKAVSRLLKTSYKNADNIRRRFMQISNGGYLCPSCLGKMVATSDGELVCQQCGYIQELPMIPLIKHTPNVGALGTENGNFKGIKKFVQECERELLQVLKGFTLSPTELEEAKRVLRHYAESYYSGRSNALDRFKVCLIALATLSQTIPQLKHTPSFYLLSGPLLRRRT